ncbi:MAG: Phage terminase, large subunit, PBSX family, partial [Candidatus Collierbacteria bacterium GW2011_GWB1_44_6]
EVKIYNNWDFCEALPDVDTIFGLDFGYNHPTCLVEIANKDDEFYADEIIYRRFMTNEDLIKVMDELKISKKKVIFADAEDAQRIAELQRAGYNVVSANKEKGSVKAGIDYIKRHRVHLTKRSINIHKEQKMYSWKKKGEVILDEPVKLNDDGMDAIRYPIWSMYGKVRKLSGII